MKANKRHIYINLIIILMMVCVLPCTLKREIKQILAIPVAQVNPLEKANNAFFCADFTKKETKKVTTSYQKKEIQKHHYQFDLISEKIDSLRCKISSFSGIKLFNPIHIYILHEQYLI